MFRKAGYSIIRMILLIRNYGVKKGFILWARICFSFSANIKISSGLFRNPVILRKKDSDLDIFDQVFTERQYKWFGSDTLSPNIIVDAGSNIGLSALYFANQYPQANIFCIEPVESNYALLRSNTSGYGQIKIMQGAIWHKDENLDIQNPEGYSAGKALQKGTDSSSIKGYTIQSIMNHFNIKHIDILKIDIEGAEKEIFQLGDLSWLDHVDILVIELHDMYREGTSVAFFSALHDRFKKMYTQGENLICYLKN
jgi:FkbM family methyltransferase